MKTHTHDVLIAGAGPTGLMLAAELALAKIDVAIIERRRDSSVEGSRASGLHTRTIEELDQRGVADRFLSQGKLVTQMPAFDALIDIGDLPTRHPYYLALWQEKIERTLSDWLAELGVNIHREREVTGFTEDEHGVDAEISGGAAMRAKYLIGCDGGRSVVRKKAGIAFPGWDATTSFLIVEAKTVDEPAWGMRHGERGINAIAKLDDGARMRAVLVEPELRGAEEATAEDLRAALVAAYGTDFGLREIDFLSRFTDAVRQAATYRKGRVLVAGDAAHVHSPHGGQGLNLGMRDAVNLGWKLAAVVNEAMPASLLDTYHDERHAADERILKTTMALAAAHRGDARTEALREMLTEFVKTDELRKRYAARMSGLDTHYEIGDAHPMVGRRMPDIELTIGNASHRLFTFLRAARPLFLHLDPRSAFDLRPWEDRVRQIHATYTGTCELPAVGGVPVPRAVLIRPDGYVAWAGEAMGDSLREALTKWLGPARDPS